MKIKILFFFALVAVISNSCKKQMEQISMEQNLGDFDTLRLNSVFKVYLTQGTENKIQINGARKILEKISITNENNALTLKNNYKGNWMHPGNNKISVFLTVKKITTLIANETCRIESINALQTDTFTLVMASKLNEAELQINCNSFTYWNNFPCGGRIKLAGTTNSLQFFNVALMAVDASNFITNYATVVNSSKGDCKINCLQKLIYKIGGEGNIYLKGNPPEIVHENLNSTGKLIFE